MKFKFTIQGDSFEDIEVYTRSVDYYLALANIFSQIRNWNKHGCEYDADTIEAVYDMMWEVANDYKVDPLG